MTTFLAIAFILVAVLLVLVILVQRGRGGGLSGAFGSGGGSTAAFGTKTGDVFTTFTVVLFVIFMLLAIWLNFRFQAHKETIAGGITTQPNVIDLPNGGAVPGGTTGTPTTGPSAGTANMSPAIPGPVTPATPATPPASQPAK